MYDMNNRYQRLCDLKTELTSHESPIGDWKIAKCIEAYLVGANLPYDIEELHNERQAIRDEINILEDEIMNEQNQVDLIQD